jgi:hypothetical protein
VKGGEGRGRKGREEKGGEGRGEEGREGRRKGSLLLLAPRRLEDTFSSPGPDPLALFRQLAHCENLLHFLGRRMVRLQSRTVFKIPEFRGFSVQIPENFQEIFTT